MHWSSIYFKNEQTLKIVKNVTKEGYVMHILESHSQAEYAL